MNTAFTSDEISKALFDHDPMNTCCKENDCFDEYDRVAQGVVYRLEEGFDLKQSLVIELAEWFLDNEGVSTNSLMPVIEQIKGNNSNDV